MPSLFSSLSLIHIFKGKVDITYFRTLAFRPVPFHVPKRFRDTLLIAEPVSYTHLDVYKRQGQSYLCRGNASCTAESVKNFHNTIVGSYGFGLEAWQGLPVVVDVYKRQRQWHMHARSLLQTVSASSEPFRQSPLFPDKKTLINTCLLYTSRCV